MESTETPKKLERTSQGRNAYPRLCHVLASLRTRERAHCLNSLEHCLVAVYVSSKIEVTLLNIKNVAAHLQAAAKASHGITIKQELNK